MRTTGVPSLSWQADARQAVGRALQLGTDGRRGNQPPDGPTDTDGIWTSCRALGASSYVGDGMWR
ncbi:Hypothetical protein SMAX5B_009163 [Scophthalmus maximus]|uniref:Uncharacterized protein n=1 Tax=Scophthalmus maximus TaxID=52904 RepID=A0A2U9C5C8_SCOMX|nr:Hypothetical protein SMAX5B_009163 [Scophthalmus maximus]